MMRHTLTAVALAVFCTACAEPSRESTSDPVAIAETPQSGMAVLNAAQIKQIEEIAAEIAKQSNANKHLHLDDMTSSFNTIAAGRNVRFENVLRVKNDLSRDEITQWLVATQQEIIPSTCAQNVNNPAFDRGLSYTFSYTSMYEQKMGEIIVDKTTCKRFGY